MISLLKELIYIILVVVIIGFLLEKNNTLINLIFKPFNQEDEFSLKNLLFSVCITDLILKLFTVACKIVFTLLPSAVVEYKNRVSLNEFSLEIELETNFCSFREESI